MGVFVTVGNAQVTCVASSGSLRPSDRYEYARVNDYGSRDEKRDVQRNCRQRTHYLLRIGAGQMHGRNDRKANDK